MQPGDSALLRHVFGGRVGWAVPVTVVEDTPERVALLRRVGTRTKAPARDTAREFFAAVAAGTYDVVDLTWERTSALEIAPLGRAHSVWPMWVEDTWQFACWYVNLQEPMRRTRFGWDTFDQSLDIVVHPDRSWQWKDEDHFALLQEVGILSATAAAEVRQEGERVVADLDAERYPFDRDWSDWRPDPSWSVPTMPPDWSTL